ncbi:MAG: hypothetical protein NT061_03485 [Spirochaetes bacterium]|nr:hypothetical protein [Spirochaetota bacterium]
MADPYLIALLFADRVIVENNDKKGIIGIFNQFNAPSFPAVFPPWANFISIGNVKGLHTFRLDLEPESEGQPIASFKGEINGNDNEGLADIMINHVATVFPHAGQYTLRLRVDERILCTRMLMVHQVSQTAAQ